MSAQKSGPHSAAPHGKAPPSLWLVALCLACVYIIWGTTYLAIKLAIVEAGPFFLLGTRLIVAGGAFLIALRAFGHPLPTPVQWKNAGILGFLMLVIGIGGVSVAEKTVSSGAAVALISIQPLGTALWAVAFGRMPRPLEWVAITIGVLGTLVMVVGQDFTASPLGTALILFGVASWTLAANLAGKLDLPPGGMGFAAEMLIAGVIGMVISAALGESWQLPESPQVWWAWVYLVTFGSLIAFSAYRYLVDRVSPTLAATYAYVNPPVALFVGWWLGAEHFSVNTFIGLPIVLLAVGLHAFSWKASRATQATSA